MNPIEYLKNFFFPSDDEIEDDDEGFEPVAPARKPVAEAPHPKEEEEEEEAVAAAPSSAPSYENPASAVSPNSTPKERNNATERNSGNSRRNTVVNIQTTAQLQVVLVKPSAFTDAKQIADHLIAKKTVVLNLETASPENKRRIIDFLVGVAYANGGSLKPVANLTYIITPYNVGFIGEDLVGELENNGVFI